MKFTPLPGEHWLNRISFEDFATLPWNSPQGLSEEKQLDVLGLVHDPGQVQWPNPSLIAGPDGKLLVVGSSEVLVLGSNGLILGRFPRPDGGADLFSLTGRGELIFAQNQPGQPARMGKINKEGQLVWAHEGEQYAVKQILSRGDSLYAVSGHKQKTVVWQLDPENGNFGPEIMSLGFGGPVLLGKDGEFCFVSYDPLLRTRFWNCQVPGEQARSTRIDPEGHGPFTRAVGADDESTGYGSWGKGLSILKPGQEHSLTIYFDGMIAIGDGQYCLSNNISGTQEVQLLRKSASGVAEAYTLTIPEEIAEPLHRPAWLVVGQKGSNYRLLGRDPQTYRWNLVEYDPATGKFDLQPAPVDLAPLGEFLCPVVSWAVMRDGSIIFPVLGEKALRLVKMNVK